jgi:outer membrane receptor for ferrienterochelin and colicins
MLVHLVRRYPQFGRRRLVLVLVWLAILAVLLAPRGAAAQGTVTGRVLDAETGQPIADVNVELISGGRQRVASATTDADGRFQIAGAPAGSYSLVVSRLGYEIRRIDAIAVTGASIDVGTVSLVSRALRMNPIVVTPSRVEEKALKAPASTWVVDQRDIEARPATTAVDHVRDVPGVDVASSGLTQNTVVTRGFDNVFSGAMLVLTDNRWASVPSLRFNAYNLIPATDEDIERIELALGPGSALYGPNVSQGVMHILTKSPLDYPGSTLTGIVGEREVVQASGRHAGRVGERFGYKISGNYFRGNEWKYRDPVEDSLRAVALGRGADPETLRIAARDFDAERFNGDGRVDWKFADQSSLVLSGGFSQLGSSIELTGIGAAQGRDWRSSYAQARLRHRRLFAQSYVNFSDAGESYTLRDGGRLRDHSYVLVGQAQHTDQPWERLRLVYGADYIRTVPQTEGTITGRYENDDEITEVGGYVQSETRVTPRLDFVAAARLDHHSRVADEVFSPRAAFVYKVADGHNLRLTYNRAFSQPTSNNLFLDLRSAQDFGGLPFDVRVTGVPDDGFHFDRDANGMPFMRSPFTPPGLGGPSQELPLDVTVFWPVVVQILQSRGIDISGVPAPTAAQVGSVMRSLNPTTRSFERVQDVADVDALRPQVTNSFEIGYKGFFANRARVGIDLYHSRIENFLSPILVATPNVFLERNALADYLDDYMSRAQAVTLAAAIAGVDGSATFTGIPLATVTPVNTVGDPYDIFLTYRNFGQVNLWGMDFGVTLIASDQLSFTATYSFVDRNFFRNLDGIADLSLNSPKHKGSLSGTYRNDRTGWAAEIRGRYVDAFPVNSGVYIGDIESYGLADADASYTLPFARSTVVSLSATNLLDDRHREFIGAPEIGRLVLFRVRQTF